MIVTTAYNSRSGFLSFPKSPDTLSLCSLSSAYAVHSAHGILDVNTSLRFGFSFTTPLQPLQMRVGTDAASPRMPWRYSTLRPRRLSMATQVKHPKVRVFSGSAFPPLGGDWGGRGVVDKQHAHKNRCLAHQRGERRNGFEEGAFIEGVWLPNYFFSGAVVS